mgnify:CR=1 FL=1
MKETAKNPAKHGRKAIRFLLILTAAAALIWAGLVLFKNKQTKEFLFQHNNEAKNMYNLLNTMMETDTALPQGNYTGYGRIAPACTTDRNLRTGTEQVLSTGTDPDKPVPDDR